MAHPALRPKWLAGHILALIAVIVFISMGLWQLRRLNERQDTNAEIKEMTSQPIGPLNNETAAPWIQISTTGRYLADEQILVRSRTQDGLSGYHVLTPLEYAPDRLVVVNRGFIPLALGNEDPDAAPVPEGIVEIKGVLRETQTRGSIGPTDPPDVRLEKIARVDVERYAEQLDGEVFEYWLHLTDQQPPQELYPLTAPLPGVDEGPHFSYAMQWFIFTLVVLIGYPIILRRVFKSLDTTTQR